MGGSSRDPFSTQKPTGFPIGDKADHQVFEEALRKMAEAAEKRWRAREANHSAHVAAYRKHQEWINRPWTCRNYLAAAINWVFGNGGVK